MGLSNIQWTDYTFNPWMGCRKVAPECGNCYIAETPPFKFRGLTHGSVRVRTAEGTWKQPLMWNRKAEKEGVRRRVFCLSLGDWLDDENVPIEWLADLLALIYATPNLDWLLLTKRPQNFRSRIEDARQLFSKTDRWKECGVCSLWFQNRPPSNVWIGVSAGADQAAALAIPAKIHFLSCEPMLHLLETTNGRCEKCGYTRLDAAIHWDHNLCSGTIPAAWDWIIFGGESGAKARPCSTQWIREGVQFCRDHNIAPFVKQMGSKCTDPTGEPLRLKDSHGGNMDEWPEDLRIREFPNILQPA